MWERKARACCPGPVMRARYRPCGPARSRSIPSANLEPRNPGPLAATRGPSAVSSQEARAAAGSRPFVRYSKRLCQPADPWPRFYPTLPTLPNVSSSRRGWSTVPVYCEGCVRAGKTYRPGARFMSLPRRISVTRRRYVHSIAGRWCERVGVLRADRSVLLRGENRSFFALSPSFFLTLGPGLHKFRAFFF